MALGGYLALSGAVAGTGVFLLIAGATKLRTAGGDSAIRRALRLGPGGWRAVELTAGVAECATGAAVCAGSFPAIAGIAMAGQGAAFVGLLGYVRTARIPGDCGCIRWRKPPGQGAVSWRALARAAWILAAGVLDVTARRPAGASLSRPWFDAGCAAVLLALALLSADLPPRTPRCHRRLWLPARGTLAALTRNALFQAMADSAGPFGPEVGYLRAGCTEEFRFQAVPGTGPPDGAVLFRVSHMARGASLAVQASVETEIPVPRQPRRRPVSVARVHRSLRWKPT
jgi:hypothetical protein